MNTENLIYPSDLAEMMLQKDYYWDFEDEGQPSFVSSKRVAYFERYAKLFAAHVRNAMRAEAENLVAQNVPPIGSEYLGSQLTLTFSGKYYQPFACSNVDLCPACMGEGSVEICGEHGPSVKKVECPICQGVGSFEAFVDEVWWEELDRVAARYECVVDFGEGNPLDTYLCTLTECSECGALDAAEMKYEQTGPNRVATGRWCCPECGEPIKRDEETPSS